MSRYVIFVLLVIGCVQSASASLIPAPIGTGQRSTPGGAATPDGVTAFGSWTAGEGGFVIKWNITFDALNDLYTYVYEFTNDDGTKPLNQNLSHWILEVSPSFTEDNIEDITNIGDGGLDTYDEGGDNPGLPSDIYGIKFNVGDNSAGTYTLVTDRSPVWGDFYAKDGSFTTDPGPPPTKVNTIAYNAGYGTDPNGPDDLGPDTTDFTNWIPVPDTLDGPPPPGPEITPEPASMASWAGLSLLGAYLVRRRRKTVA